MGERCRAASRRTAAKPWAGDAPELKRGSTDQKKRGEAGGGQVDEIVEPRRRPAEILVALIAVPDHAIRRVDGLIDRGARKPRDHHPQRRRHNAVGEILGEALDRRAADARSIELLCVAPHDRRHRASCIREIALLQGGCHAGDMLVKAALRQKRARKERDEDDAERQKREAELDDHGDAADNGEKNGEREHALSPFRRRVGVVAVQGIVKTGDDLADPADGMTDAADEEARIAEHGFER